MVLDGIGEQSDWNVRIEENGIMEANVIARDGDLVRVGSQQGQHINSRKTPDDLSDADTTVSECLEEERRWHHRSWPGADRG